MIQGLATTGKQCALWVRIVLLVCTFSCVGPLLGQTAVDGFDPNVNGPVRAIAIQSDGKIVIGGEFSTVGGYNCSRIARLKNGNYVIGSGFWHNGGMTVGAATWGSGTSGISGPARRLPSE